MSPNVHMPKAPLARPTHPERSTRTAPPGPPPAPDMVWIPGGTFRMGSNNHYPEERPTHPVTVDGFWIDRTPVTNARFARFVAATRHATTAQLPCVERPRDSSNVIPRGKNPG